MANILITGSSTGIGQEAAIHLARAGHRVFASCRNPEGAVDLRRRISEEKLDVNRGGIFRSKDYGKTWTHMNMHNNRPSYYSQIRVDPHDENTVYTMGLRLNVSHDGGKTFRPLLGMHDNSVRDVGE